MTHKNPGLMFGIFYLADLPLLLPISMRDKTNAPACVISCLFSGLLITLAVSYVVYHRFEKFFIRLGKPTKRA